jgi:pimeloyl-ACP methyl ester carboxylesterase
MQPYARSFRVYAVSRDPARELSTDMSTYAAQYSAAIAAQFGGPVRVMGFSTGGQLALQLAIDSPDSVKKLALVAAACRLSPAARAAQAASAEWFARGDGRRAFAALAPLMTKRPAIARLLAGLLWLTTPLGGTMNTPRWRRSCGPRTDSTPNRAFTGSPHRRSWSPARPTPCIHLTSPERPRRGSRCAG